MKAGWQQLFSGAFPSRDKPHRIDAYSEFMPPPFVGRRPYGAVDPVTFKDEDPWGWHVTEYEEALELRPGMESIASQIVISLVHLGEGRAAHGISRHKLERNACWPPELAGRAGTLAHERYVILMPLALSRTQDDMGRVRWTLFGGSEQGPARAFWKGFFTAHDRELPENEAQQFIRNLLQAAYREPAEKLRDLLEAGFRVLPQEDTDRFASGPVPRWISRFVHSESDPVEKVKYLLTFRPFESLPRQVRGAYLAGRLHLLPFPGSLLFWGIRSYWDFQRQFPMALQIPLLQMAARHGGPYGIRVPQSGWLHIPTEAVPEPDERTGPLRNTYRRTHRWVRVARHEDEVALSKVEQKLVHVLFSSSAADLGLYDKPMARNAQLWTDDFQLLLDGPRACRRDIEKAVERVTEGGMFGYRFQFPAMRAGNHEVYWHRPLVAFQGREPGKAEVVFDAPLGYLTAYEADSPDLSNPVKLWPRVLERPEHVAAIRLFQCSKEGHTHQTVMNVRKLLDFRQLFGPKSFPPSYARQLLATSKHRNLENWLASLPAEASNGAEAGKLADSIRCGLQPERVQLSKTPERSAALTMGRTARRSFEIAYWKTIASLASGDLINKDNADCVRDPVTQKLLRHHHRDLHALGEHLIAHYTRVISSCGMMGKAFAAELPFRWETQFDFSWSAGWLRNQKGEEGERNLFCVIPGRDRKRAVIMADHYDTAYMEDYYEKERGGKGARLAASGADDNHSATAALMLAAPVFCDLSRAGLLDSDVWLVHLTGEEFPSDCMGARHLSERLVNGTLELRLQDNRTCDLSGVRIQGVYVLDMVAHNNDRDRDVFQISPGEGDGAAWLALQAHTACEIWNASAAKWNCRPSRRGRGAGRRSPDGVKIPEIALHPQLHGEIRPHYDPRSSLYNTDGQIFSDAGIPVVLFMENYDINRTGYHDSHDTMVNIDLDYGVAVAAIAIEAVARAATERV